MQDVNALFLAWKTLSERAAGESSGVLNLSDSKTISTSNITATHRAITTNDSQVLRGGASFQGDSVVGLLQHMYQSGLEFAPPEPGGEGVYKTLLGVYEIFI